MYKTVVVSAEVRKVSRPSTVLFASGYDLFCDPEELGREIERVANALYSDGYEVVSIMPMSRSIYETSGQGMGGVSLTGAAVITAKKISEPDLPGAPPRVQ